MVGIVANLRRKVEGHTQTRLAILQEILIPLIRLLGVANPAYWRMVQKRPRYMVGWTPLVNGSSPGNPNALQ